MATNDDGLPVDGDAEAEAAFGRLATSTVNERVPIRVAHGCSSDLDYADGNRSNEGEWWWWVVLSGGGKEGFLSFLGRERGKKKGKKKSSS